MIINETDYLSFSKNAAKLYIPNKLGPCLANPDAEIVIVWKQVTEHKEKMGVGVWVLSWCRQFSRQERQTWAYQSAKARQRKIPGLCLNFALVTAQKSGEFKTQKTFVNLSALQSWEKMELFQKFCQKTLCGSRLQTIEAPKISTNLPILSCPPLVILSISEHYPLSWPDISPMEYKVECKHKGGASACCHCRTHTCLCLSRTLNPTPSAPTD
jgi:hypothetical protein